VTERRGWGFPTDKIRLNLSRHLRGEGIELGPGHHPYVIVLPGTSVKYLDRWVPKENRELFPELGDKAEFPTTDVVADLDAELLGMLGDQSQDFVIASHVFEHVANPLALLEDSHRVLRPGGVLLLLLPDMTITSDRLREPTTLEHLVAEYDAKVREVDDAHVEDYLRVVRSFTGTGTELAERVARERARSIHVHCWTESTFFPVLRYAVDQLDIGFEMVELVTVTDVKGSNEFGYILRRPIVQASAATNTERLLATHQLLMENRFAQSDPRLVAAAAGGVGAPARRQRHPALRAARRVQRKVQRESAKGLKLVRDKIEQHDPREGRTPKP